MELCENVAETVLSPTDCSPVCHPTVPKPRSLMDMTSFKYTLDLAWEAGSCFGPGEYLF